MKNEVKAREFNILVIEDDDRTFKTIKDGLINPEYKLHRVTTGQAAIDLAKEGYFVAIITEMQIGDMNGIELVRRLKKIDQRINIIGLTVYSFINLAIEAMKEGVYTYLMKPLNTEELNLVLRRAIENTFLLIQAGQRKYYQDIATMDGLTGVYNHRHFHEMLDWNISHLNRSPQAFSLFIIDIDDFKKYNDSFGHDEGNVVLERLAKVLTDSVRESDIVFRFGGEEFVLLLIETTKKGAYVVAERARKKISEQQFKRQVTISLGVSTFPVDAKDSEKLFELADKALYRAKADGKNRVCLYHIERRVDLRIPSQVVVSFRKIETTPPCGHPSIEGNFDRNSILEKKIKTEIATDITATHHDYNYELRDIGRHGFAFYSDEHIKISSLIKGNISLPNQGEINFSGKVVWNEELIAGKHINGVTFFEIDKKSEVALENYIQDRSNNINGIDID